MLPYLCIIKAFIFMILFQVNIIYISLSGLRWQSTHTNYHNSKLYHFQCLENYITSIYWNEHFTLNCAWNSWSFDPLSNISSLFHILLIWQAKHMYAFDINCFTPERYRYWQGFHFKMKSNMYKFYIINN